MWNDRYSAAGFSVRARAAYDPGTVGALIITAATAVTETSIAPAFSLFGVSISTANVIGSVAIAASAVGLQTSLKSIDGSQL